MNSLISKYYSGIRASRYERNRQSGKKWKFEERFVNDAVEELAIHINSVADAPVGTNRFHELLEKTRSINNITGLDFSDKMLKISAKKSAKMNFKKIDLLSEKISFPEKFDLVLSLRFLNLIEFNAVEMAISNLAKLSKKFLIISIRVQDVHNESQFIEDKIYVHNLNRFKLLVAKTGMQIKKEDRFIENRMGVYHMMLLEKN